MEHTIYLEKNGEILRSFTGPIDDLLQNLAEGEAAIPGSASWVTHKVVDTEFVEHAQPRTQPFEHAAWDPHSASWFDPMEDKALRQFEIAKRRDVIKQKIAKVEASQSRPLRALAVAWAAEMAPDPADVQALAEKDELIASLRAELQRLPKS